MRRAALLAFVALAGCDRHALPLRRDALAAVVRAVATCSDASGQLTPFLRRGDRAGAENAAIAARNLCSTARAQIVAAVGTGTALDACYASVDRQVAFQQAELRSLDSPTLANGRAVAAGLDDTIGDQNRCSVAIAAAGRAG